jgi:UDP-N-acetylmuramate--alanine ligase
VSDLLHTTRRVHLVGMGGAGMSGLARILLQRGHVVSGSDLRENRSLDALEILGARVEIGHRAENLQDAEVVVISSAVPRDNPEVAAAREHGLTVLRRAEMLAALMEGEQGVVITGTHGKTTTTSMAVVALQAAGGDPSFAIGGALNESGTNAHGGSDGLFIAEADESDRSFLVFRPHLAVVTNIEHDHPEEFRDLTEVTAAFRDFLDRRAVGAPALMCLDDPVTAEVVEVTEAPVITYGTDPRADVRLLPGDDGEHRLRRDGAPLVSFRLGVPGRHNALNATAALAVCDWAGVDLEAAASGLERFTGAARRFQRLGTVGGVTVVDDYAHHPTELRATLAAARSVEAGRVVLVVQPHRYSRTERLGAELGRAASAADVVLVTDVYASSEAPVPGVSGQLVADAAVDAGANVRYQPHLTDVVDDLVELVRDGDLVLTTGAGDVTQIGPMLLHRLGGGT